MVKAPALSILPMIAFRDALCITHNPVNGTVSQGREGPARVAGCRITLRTPVGIFRKAALWNLSSGSSSLFSIHRMLLCYNIELATDLLGDWLVDVTYGRVGLRGRLIRHVASAEAEARRIVHQSLQRRSTALWRIDMQYQLSQMGNQAGWLS